MFSNIGKKIKGLAIAIYIIEAVGAFITGISICAIDTDLVFIGLPIAVLGPVVLWIFSWFLYGFGEIIDKLSDIEKNTRGLRETGVNVPRYTNTVCATEVNNVPCAQPQVSIAEQVVKVESADDRTRMIEKLYNDGLISKDEYENALKSVNREE